MIMRSMSCEIGILQFCLPMDMDIFSNICQVIKNLDTLWQKKVRLEMSGSEYVPSEYPPNLAFR